jgi:hypothetical protein
MDQVGELSPLHAPYEPIVVSSEQGGTTLGTVRMTYRYARIDSDGRQFRSAPYPTEQFVLQNSVSEPTGSVIINIPTLRHTQAPMTDAGNLLILLYSTTDGGTDPSLQMILHNDPREDHIAVEINPLAFDSTGELLDTIGVSQGVLDQAALPPLRLVTQGKDRTWGVGPDDSIWFSQRNRAGSGPEFNEALTTAWPDGSGQITAIAPLPGFDSLVVFRQDAVGIISGPGPDGLGLNGEFPVITLPTKGGCTNARSVVTGPLGVYYQRAADGRMALVVGNGAPIEIHQGMEDYRLTHSPRASLHDEGERLIRWYCFNGEILNLDDDWKGESSPAGRWILDRRSEEPFPEFKGARLIAGEPVVLLPGESDEIQLLDPSAGYFDYGAAVLKKQTTGRMSPAGFLSEFDVKEVQMSSTEVEPGSTYDYTLTRDTGETETKEDVTDETADVKFWSGIDRTRDVRLTIEETSAAGAGRKFDGVQFEIGVYGRPANPRRRV